MNTDTQSRRDMLLAGAAGIAATLTSATRGAEKDSPKQIARIPDNEAAPSSGLKVSLAGYSFRDDLDKPGKHGKMSLFDLVKLCTELNTDAIEPTSYYFYSTDDKYLFDLKRAIFRAGLDISCTPTRSNFCKPAGPELDKELADLRKWIDCAVKLGSPAIRIFAGAPDRSIAREKQFANAVHGVKEACAYAAKYGIYLTIENHGYLTETAEDVLRLMDAVDSEWLGLNMDTGNFGIDPYGSMARVAPRAVTCQVKMLVHNPATKKQESADFNRIVGIMRNAKYRGYLALEYEGNDPHKDVPILIHKLQAAVRA